MRASSRPEEDPPGKMRSECVVPSAWTNWTLHVLPGSTLPPFFLGWPTK